MSPYLETLIREAVNSRRLKPEDIRGCSEDDIVGLETRMDVQLPSSFKAYLKRMGWSPGRLLAASDIRFGCLHELTSEARDAAKHNSTNLPDDCFVFFAHQGYDYMYFKLSDGDDPKVYRYHLSWTEPRQVFHSFSGYLAWMFKTQLEVPPDELETSS